MWYFRLPNVWAVTVACDEDTDEAEHAKEYSSDFVRRHMSIMLGG